MAFRHQWVLRPFIGAPLEPNPLAESDRRHGSASARPTATRTDHRPPRWSSTLATSGPGLPRQHKIPGLQPSSYGSLRGQTRVRTAGGTGVSPENVGRQPPHRVHLTAMSNAFVERVIGSIRRDCLDHVVVLNDSYLKRILTSYFKYYHHWRTHLSLGMDSPESRSLQPPALRNVIQLPEVGGLHHRYERVAA